MSTDWVAAVAKMRHLVGVYLAVLAKGPLTPHQAASLETDLKTLDVDLAGLSASLATVSVIPVAPVVPSSATSRFVADFGAAPGDIHDATVRKIQAAGEFVQNADGSWPAKSEADWLALFAQYGGNAAVAALLVTQFNPLEIVGDLGNVPPQAVPIIQKYWSGLVGSEGVWYAYKDGALLGSHIGDWTEASLWCVSVGISPNSNAWY